MGKSKTRYARRLLPLMEQVRIFLDGDLTGPAIIELCRDCPGLAYDIVALASPNLVSCLAILTAFSFTDISHSGRAS
jgi:hypothetical protein